MIEIKRAPGAAGGGVTTMAAIGAVPNANGASISGSTLTLQPASASFGGVVTTGSQTFAGVKTFNEGGIAVGSSGTLIGTISISDSFSAADTLMTSSAAGISLVGATNTSTAIVSNTAYDGLSANDSYARVILGNTTTVTEAGSGTHPFIGQLAIKPLTITSGAGATTNAATLYIEGAATGTASPTNNYAVWVDDGAVRIDGTIELGAASDTTISRSAAGVLAVEGVRVITDNSTTSGKILKNNGTTFVASTETYAAPGTSGNVMTSDGTNWTSAAPAGSFGMQGMRDGNVAYADASTYFFGLSNATNTTGGNNRVYVPVACTIVAARVTWSNSTPGSAENSTVYIRKNDTSDTAISTVVDLSTSYAQFGNTSLSIAMSAGDYFEIKWESPTWTSNPTSRVFWCIYAITS